MVDWCLRQRGMTDAEGWCDSPCRVLLPSLVSIRPEAELQYRGKRMHPHSPMQVWTLYTSNSRCPLLILHLILSAQWPPAQSVRRKMIHICPQRFQNFSEDSVKSSSASLRINRESAAAKTVVCCTAIPLGSSYALAGRVLTPPWICSCLVALLMR